MEDSKDKKGKKVEEGENDITPLKIDPKWCVR